MKGKIFLLVGFAFLLANCASYRKTCNYCPPYCNDNSQCGYCTPCNNYFPCIDDVSNCNDAPWLYHGEKYGY